MLIKPLLFGKSYYSLVIFVFQLVYFHRAGIGSLSLIKGQCESDAYRAVEYPRSETELEVIVDPKMVAPWRHLALVEHL